MKFKLVENIDNDLLEDIEVLTEETLNRIINGHDKDGYVMLSASRRDALNKENPNEKEIWDENNIRTNNLKKDIRDLGYSYVPVYGGYKETGSDKASVEKSFIVFPYNNRKDSYGDFDTFEKNMIDLGNKYNQDSILVKRKEGRPFYFDLKSGNSDKPFDSISVNDTQKQYFTALKSWKDISLNKGNKDEWEGKPQRFSYEYEESYLSKKPATIMGRHSRHMLGELMDQEV